MVRVERLRFGYGRQELFRDVDLGLSPGNIYGLLGLNGAGKSSLLRLLAGLLFPVSGRIDALGHEPARRAPGFLSRIFLLPEDVQVPGVTEREFIALHAPFYPAFDHALMDRCLAVLEVPRGRRLTSLSLGQKKKFLLSFGLASAAALIVLDEPTNGLDIPSKGQFRRLVAEALTEERTIVVATHQVRDVESLIDRIVILHEGKVLLEQSISTLGARIRTSSGASPPDGNDGDLLYSEPTLGGFATVRKDRDAGDGRLDLELLFKAVLAAPDACSALGETQRRA